MIPLHHDPHFTFRFADYKIIPRFHLEGVESGRRVSAFKIDPGTGERLGLLATATVGEEGWVDLPEPIIVRAGEALWPYHPPPGEGVVQFFLRNPPRPLLPRLLVREAEQEQPTAKLKDGYQSLNVALPVLVREDVEQAAVDQRVEPLTPVLKCQGGPDQEGGAQTSLGCLAVRPVDRLIKEVEARDVATPSGEVQGILPGAVAGVEGRPMIRSATSRTACCGLPMPQGAWPA